MTTNKIKTKTSGTRNDTKCRMCKAIDETTTHLVSVCPKHLQKEYKQQLDWMGKTAYWNICRKKGLNIPKK